MSNYDPNEFIKALGNVKNNQPAPNCRFCGGQKFTTTHNMTTLLVNGDFDSISLGTTVPAGMLICERCGHIEFFSLGVLGLIKKKDGKEDGEQKKQK